MKYERRIHGLWKILSDNLGVKSESVTWLVCRNKRHCRSSIKTHFRLCHINFIKPVTYSALLPPKAYDNPQLWNEFMRVTKNFLQSIIRYYDVRMSHFCTFSCGLNAYTVFVSRNIFHVHLNIVICTSRILLQQKRTLSKSIASSTKQTLTLSFNKNMAELFNHVFDHGNSNLQHLLAHTVTRMDQSLLRMSTNHRFSFRVWYVSFTCLPHVAVLSLGCLPRVALLLLLFHHNHNALVSSSTHAHDERYEILLAFPLPTTQHYYRD